MNLSTAAPFAEAVERLDRKTPLGSALRTEGWASAPLEIREAAFFSAAVQDERVLNEMKRRIASDLRADPTVRFNGKSGFVADMRRSLGAAPGDSGKLTDITSRRRLELIYQMQTEEAYEYGRHKQSQAPELLDAFPARELIREASREKEREWETRWLAAGGQIYGVGRMIALVNDPIWTTISRFGRPYPPFDFGSGMGLRQIDRDEAEALGVIAPGEQPAAEDPSFNAVRQASVRGLPEDAVERLGDLFGAAFRSDGTLAAVSTVDTGDLYGRARQGEVFKSTAYENVTPAQAAAIAEVTGGTDLSRYRHSVDSSAIKHTHKEHGSAATEAARGQIAITQADFDALPAITRNISEVRDGGIDPVLNLQRIASISKADDGAYYMIEEVRTPKKGHLSLVTLMKFKGQAPRANPKMRRANVQNAPDAK